MTHAWVGFEKRISTGRCSTGPSCVVVACAGKRRRTRLRHVDMQVQRQRVRRVQGQRPL